MQLPDSYTIKLRFIPGYTGRKSHFFFGDQANTFTGAVPLPCPSLY